jgi:dolichol-phosphate mannosyltransferase
MVLPPQLQTPEPTPQGSLQILPLAEMGSPGDKNLVPTLTLSLAIPTYNEGKNIEPLVERLVTLLDQVIADDYELIVVDDDSPDLTWQTALALTTTYPQLRCCDDRMNGGCRRR